MKYEQILLYKSPGFDLSTISKSECGRMPIFLIDLAVKWKNKASQRNFEPVVKIRLVYKGPGKPETSSKKWMDNIKKSFFRVYLPKGKDATDPQLGTFTVVSFTPLSFLSYENEPGLE